MGVGEVVGWDAGGSGVEVHPLAHEPDRVTSIMGHTPMKRFGEARELIGATLLLASDAAGSFITGEELIVDGGFHAMTI